MHAFLQISCQSISDINKTLKPRSINRGSNQITKEVVKMKEKEKALEMAKEIAFEKSSVDIERKNRITALNERQSHIALLQIAEYILNYCNCDTVSFEEAFDDAETF